MRITRDRSFYKQMVLLALPMVLQNLITFSVGLADNLMIGSLGDSAVSGVYLANQIQTVLQVITAGIEGGILLLSSQYWGKRDTESIRRVVSVGVLTAMSLGLLFSIVCTAAPVGVITVFTSEGSTVREGAAYLGILCYSFFFFCITQSLIASMRSVESTRVGMYVSLFSLVTDICLNYILIFGKLGFPALGVRGAAIATLIARVSECIITVIYVRFIDRKLKMRFHHLLHIDRALAKDYFRYGLPVIAGQLVWGCNLAAGSKILGAISEPVITAAGLANTVNNMMYVCMNGFSGAVGILIGKKVGRGDVDDMPEYANAVQLLFTGLGILTGSFFALICDPFISLYDISAAAAEYSRQFIHVLCFTSVGTCYECACLFGLVKSGGDVSFVLKNDAVSIFLVVLPLSVVGLLLGWEPWIIFLCLKSDQIFKCVVAFFKIRRYNWMKNLTKDTHAAKSEKTLA